MFEGWRMLDFSSARTRTTPSPGLMRRGGLTISMDLTASGHCPTLK